MAARRLEREDKRPCCARPAPHAPPPAAAISRAVQSAIAPMSANAGPCEPPCPGRSTASTLKPWWANQRLWERPDAVIHPRAVENLTTSGWLNTPARAACRGEYGETINREPHDRPFSFLCEARKAWPRSAMMSPNRSTADAERQVGLDGGRSQRQALSESGHVGFVGALKPPERAEVGSLD